MWYNPATIIVNNKIVDREQASPDGTESRAEMGAIPAPITAMFAALEMRAEKYEYTGAYLPT